MAKKISKKEKILRFVESKGGIARFSEIQEFIVDMNYGKGTYKKRTINRWSGRLENPWRGYYCTAFWEGSRYSRTRGHLITGDDRLERIGDGKYMVVRTKRPVATIALGTPIKKEKVDISKWL